MLYLISFGPSWVVRKVDSFRLLEAASNERRVSLDLEVPADVPRAWFLEGDRWILPLSLVKKEPLTSFDATIGKSDPCSIADRAVNAEVALNAVVAAFELGLQAPVSSVLKSVIRTIVDEKPTSRSLSQVQALRTSGAWRRQQIPDDLRKVSEQAWDLLLLLFQNFLLCAVMADDPSGKRLLIKYRYSWQIEGRPALLDVRSRVFAPVGWAPVKVSFDLGNVLVEAASYHLEVHAAPGSQLESVEVTDNQHQVDILLRSDLAHLVARTGPRGLPGDATVLIGHASGGDWTPWLGLLLSPRCSSRCSSLPQA